MEKKMENEMETAIYRVVDIELNGDTTPIMENQEQMENEMETGIIVVGGSQEGFSGYAKVI